MDETIEELLVQMSWRESKNDHDSADIALNSFLKLVEQFIKSLCYSQSNGDDLVFRDYYRLLILDFWENCGNYDDKRNPEDSPETRVKKWLSWRMRAVIRDYWSKRTATKSGVLGVESFEEPFEEGSFFEDIDINEDKLKLSLEKILTAMELDILQTHYTFKGYVPNEISEALCKEYGISESYRRVIKSRALKKIKETTAQKSLSLKKA